MSRASYLNQCAIDTWKRLHTGVTVRVTSALLKTFLLKYGDDFTLGGEAATLHRRPLGAGVYELQIQRRTV